MTTTITNDGELDDSEALLLMLLTTQTKIITTTTTTTTPTTTTTATTTTTTTICLRNEFRKRGDCPAKASKVAVRGNLRKSLVPSRD